MSFYVNWTVSLSNWDFAALHKHESHIERSVKKLQPLESTAGFETYIRTSNTDIGLAFILLEINL